MKLDEFLRETTFSKYRKEVEEFYDEFVKEGCEIFLWTSFADDLKAN